MDRTGRALSACLGGGNNIIWDFLHRTWWRQRWLKGQVGRTLSPSCLAPRARTCVSVVNMCQSETRSV